MARAKTSLAQVKITELHKLLLERIDNNDLAEMEKVERYIDLVKEVRKITAILNKEGSVVVTKNGAQSFTKAHPLIKERNNINTTLLNIEKSFKWEDEDDNKKTKTSLSDLMG
jgi:hypothetical protein